MKRIDKSAEELNISKDEFAKLYFKEQGCELLETYEHTMKKMKFRCKCGREGNVCWNKFTQRKRRCGYCSDNGRKKPHTLEEVKTIFEKEGCKYLSETFINVSTHVQYLCNCGKESTTTVSDFKQGYRCKSCGILKQSGDKHWKWIKDREQFKLKRKFRDKYRNVLRYALDATNQKKNDRTAKLLGYTCEQLRNHIESHSTWQDLKEENWEIDHIFPIQAFVEYGIWDAKLINCLENLRPLLDLENRSKCDKYNKEEFENWLKSKGVIL